MRTQSDPDAATVDQFAIDRQVTVANREKLARNVNLLYWYERLYQHQFDDISGFERLRVLEIGSGTSPIKRFHPHVLTSDILDLEGVDYVLDCHELGRFDAIPDGSLDVITLTNVLHHLRDPVAFLLGAAVKLKPGGRVIATEPYFSFVSNLIYRYLHPEPVDLDIEKPLLESVEGPLASANIALPYLIFRKHPEWAARLEPHYDLSPDLCPFTGLAYMITGGISKRIPLPHTLYGALFAADQFLARILPNAFAAFFTITLVRPAERVG